MGEPNLEGWRRLAAAILIRAHRDANSAKGELATEARAFLKGEGGRQLVILLDLDPKRLDAVLAGLPKIGSQQLKLPGIE